MNINFWNYFWEKKKIIDIKELHIPTSTRHLFDCQLHVFSSLTVQFFTYNNKHSTQNIPDRRAKIKGTNDNESNETHGILQAILCNCPSLLILTCLSPSCSSFSS